jgi:hypothetical protein
MNTKLTLRLDDSLIENAKAEAAKRGKSVSQMVADFFDLLSKQPEIEDKELPPITRSLYGIIELSQIDEEDYKKHLEEKYL